MDGPFRPRPLELKRSWIEIAAELAHALPGHPNVLAIPLSEVNEWHAAAARIMGADKD